MSRVLTLASIFSAFSVKRIREIAQALDAKPTDWRNRQNLTRAISNALARTDGQELVSALTISELRDALLTLDEHVSGTKRVPLAQRLLAILGFLPKRNETPDSTEDRDGAVEEGRRILPNAPPGSVTLLSMTLHTDLLQRHESQFFDRKQVELKPGKLATHIAAFANADGGQIVVGITDGKGSTPTLAGFTRQEEANAHIQQSYFGLDPAVDGLVHRFHEYRDQNTGHFRYLLDIEVPRSTHVHYTSDKHCYIRKGAQSIQVPDDRIGDLLYSKGVKSYEDSRIVGYDSASLLAHKAANSYFLRVPTADKSAFLRSQRIVAPSHNGAFEATACAVLLLDDSPQAALPTRCGIKILKLETTETKYDRKFLVDDPISIEGCAEQLINDSVGKILEMMSLISFEREGEYVTLSFPREAIHELVANAVLHRDYSIKDDIQIRIYQNRIEIQSPGRLPGPVNTTNIRHERFARNPKLVRLLNKLPSPPNRDVGEGIDTVFNTMAGAKLREPQFVESANFFVATLRHESAATPQQQILTWLREKEGRTITNSVARDLTGIGGENKIKRIFQGMMSAGLIEWTDPNAAKNKVSYQLTKKGRRGA